MAATIAITPFSPPENDLYGILPPWARRISDLQTAIPELAKDARRIAEVDSLLAEVEGDSTP
jgi:hypothetical protein